jgi:hypothetical protein
MTMIDLNEPFAVAKQHENHACRVSFPVAGEVTFNRNQFALCKSTLAFYFWKEQKLNNNYNRLIILLLLRNADAVDYSIHLYII